MQLLLRMMGWIVCVIYATIPSFWLLIHPRVDYWRSHSRSPYCVLIPTWIGMWIILGAITSPWRQLPLYRTAWTWVPASALFIAGFCIYKSSGKHFSSAQLGGVPEVVLGHPEQRLVTTGIRARVRHPVYLAHLCEMLGWTMGTGLIVCYALTAFAVISGAVMIRLEDAELERRFREEYRAYRRKVPAMLPKIRARISL
jgi:protein-S-isoprenylcysteine O-methyltransferase Ste14